MSNSKAYEPPGGSKRNWPDDAGRWLRPPAGALRTARISLDPPAGQCDDGGLCRHSPPSGPADDPLFLPRLRQAPQGPPGGSGAEDLLPPLRAAAAQPAAPAHTPPVQQP